MNLFEYTYNLVRQIPPGKISTYGAVALALGDIRASRAVGLIMNQNPDADDMPCYKIVYSDGRLGGFGRGINDKIRRLSNDDIVVKDGRIVDFQNVLFNDFKTEYPLKQLRQEQIELSKKVIIEDDFDNISTVAGIDVSYPTNEFDKACGSCIVVDYNTKKVIEEKIVFVQTEFPYIPTYFSFREFPVVEELVKSLYVEPSIFMFDGNGILHPYRCGYATYAGLKLNCPSIGVAKTLLCGEIKDNVVLLNNEKIGREIFSKQAKKPLYISPGHRISHDTCVNIVWQMQKNKIPEPLRLAHIHSKKGLVKRG